MTFDYGVVKVRPATLEDAKLLAPRLRKDDLQELAAGSTNTPEEALTYGIKHSESAYAAVTADGVIAIWGVVRVDNVTGLVWLLGSDDLFKIKFKFLKHSREWLERISEGYRILGNVVDERNKTHVRWLKWLGFQFFRRIPCGLHGEAFLEFSKLVG